VPVTDPDSTISDIQPEEELDAREFDKKQRVLLLRFQGLPLDKIAPELHIGDPICELLNLHRLTHISIRKLSATAFESNEFLLGDALSLVREQIEKVLLVYLLVSDPAKWLPLYLQDGWRAMCRYFRAMRERTSHLPRFTEWNDAIGPRYLDEMRKGLGITDEQVKAFEFLLDHPGKELPPKLKPYMMEKFPDPAQIVTKAKQAGARVGLALSHLYSEYRHFGQFTHALAGKVMLAKLARDPRAAPEVKVKINDIHATNGLTASYLSAAMMCTIIYGAVNKAPDTMPALESLEGFWRKLNEFSILGKHLYKDYARHVLPPIIDGESDPG